jgi:hypothetical protein
MAEEHHGHEVRERQQQDQGPAASPLGSRQADHRDRDGQHGPDREYQPVRLRTGKEN